MPQIWKDRVQQTVTGTPGTGAFTLSTAVANYQALAAGDDGKTGFFCATEGTAWETFIGTYTHSGTSLARTTRTDSSTGSAISFTSAAIVFLDLTATIAARLATPTNLITGGDVATTMVANATYDVAMSGWATADRIYTLPAAPAIGDRVSIFIRSGNASFELIVKGNTSQTINGGSAASEWSRLFITAESMTARYVASNTWIISGEDDGRVPMCGVMNLTTSATAENADTLTYPTAKGGVWTASVDVGGICATGSDKITARRACSAVLGITALSNSGVADAASFLAVFETNGGGAIFPFQVSAFPGAVAAARVAGGRGELFALDDYIRYQYLSSQGSIGLYGGTAHVTSMSFAEVL